MLSGTLRRGWPDYELRFHFQNSYPHRYNKPRWDGKPFHGKRLLIHDEIGYGDVFQFIRYLPLVKKLGGEVLFEGKPGLKRLLSKMSGVDIFLERTKDPVAAPVFDIYLPLESLPAALRRGAS